MKITKKHITNIAFAILIGLMIYPPTKIYFIRLISFSPSLEKVENQKELSTTNWSLKGLNTDDINLKDVHAKVVFYKFLGYLVCTLHSRNAEHVRIVY